MVRSPLGRSLARCVASAALLAAVAAPAHAQPRASLTVDGLHPTTVVHDIIADAAVTYVVDGVNVAVVPEPGTVLLVGADLVLLGVAGRRHVVRA